MIRCGRVLVDGSSRAWVRAAAPLGLGHSVRVSAPTPTSFTRPSRWFRTTHSKSTWPPILLAVLNKIGHAGAIIIGRKFKNLSPELKVKYFAKARKHRRYLYGFLTSTGAGAFAYYVAHIEEAPITKRKRFLAFSEDHMQMMAEMEFKSLLECHQYFLLPSTDPRHQRVYRVAQRLIEANRDLFEARGTKKEWTLSVIEDNRELNAFVLSCGNIFVYTALLDLCDDEGPSDSMLAIILAHEFAHVLLSHSREQMSRLHLVEAVLLIPLLLLWCFVQSDATAAVFHWISSYVSDLLLHLPYSRALETEADEVGLLLAARACFDVRECIVWKKMEIKRKMTEGGDPDFDFHFLSTHPSSETRFENLMARLPEALETRDTCKCPPLEFMDATKRIGDFQLRLKEESTEKTRLVAKPLEV